ncbi:ABC transporter substrate-binding protein [Paractinoplanes rishiriensis]|uniref:Sugar ABC transporter substrate-binding protein n=1 Tax=Paractinoplanes rishiriensis TaxID=1050105 RepID=A0A919MYV4_9ACTN|nr:extracellular solute-binding protein [Actinoplanes rishiriensis]GIE97505.1 sugar ABC transporter substrate-binding protein [Actinoplanes rishiriensis]
MYTLNRRDLLRMAGLAGAAASLSACGRGFGGGGDEDEAGKVTINMVWWGDAARAERTRKALDLFEKQNPGLKVTTEYQDSGPYKDKLATRFAAGDAPDLLAMRTDSLQEYVSRGALLDLAGAADIDLTGVGDAARRLGAVGAKNFGVPVGLNSSGFVINKALADKYKVAIPDGDSWSWQDLAAFARDINRASGGKVYGTHFDPATLASLMIFTRQRGEDFFTEAGKVGFTEATIAAWFTMVEAMRAEGGFPKAGVIDPNAGSAGGEMYLGRGVIASQIIPTNNFLGYNKLVDGTLVLHRMPGEKQGTRPGQSVDTPALWSVAAGSKHPAEARKLLNFLINDVEAARATGTTRGVPASKTVADQIKDTLEPDDQTATDYLTELQGEKLAPSYLYPAGASTLPGTLKSIATEIEFKRLTPAAGAKKFTEAATKALGA